MLQSPGKTVLMKNYLLDWPVGICLRELSLLLIEVGRHSPPRVIPLASLGRQANKDPSALDSDTMFQVSASNSLQQWALT